MFYEIYKDSWIKIEKILWITIDEIDDADRAEAPEDCEYSITIEFIDKEKQFKCYLNEIEKENLVRVMREFCHEVL